MNLRELFTAAGVPAVRLEGEAEVIGMTMDSRRVKPGAMFVCMPPASDKSRDSHEFLPAAQSAGAGSALVYSDAGFEAARRLGLAAALLSPDMYQDSLWKIAKVAFGNPSASMKVIGVTGTNGKTTTAWLIRDMLQALGVRAAYLGTLGFQLPGEERELQNTTPFAVELNELLAEARDKGVGAIAMEVSSHALAEKRVDGVEFDVGVFTNLTQDHLDFHGSMEAYESAKLRLFTELPKQSTKRFVAAINVDDPAGQRIAERLASQVELIRFSVGDRVGAQHGVQFDLKGVALEVSIGRIGLSLYTDGHGSDGFYAPLGGSYNVENLVAASAAMLAQGYWVSDVGRAGHYVRPVPGRFEAVPNDAGIGIIVDYAHTPDALEKLLDTVREILNSESHNPPPAPPGAGGEPRGVDSKLQTPNSKLITVFGCGGDRDRTKRPKMAKAASERSDVTVVTSDNPRTEDPVTIVEEVATGIVGDVDWTHVPGRTSTPQPPPPPSHEPSPQGEGGEAVVIIDRREAIAHAIRIARPGDVVVIAGKGHENYQIIGRTKYPMDDRELAREALALRPNR